MVPSNIFPWLISCLLMSKVTLATEITDWFTVATASQDPGSCSSYIDAFDIHMDDVITLYDAIIEAQDYAFGDLRHENSDDGEKTLVAQKLFTTYFGIQFLEEFNNLYGQFIDDKTYQAPKTPPRVFCSDPGQKFDWDAIAFGPDGNALTDTDGEGISIKTLYKEQRGKFPYWVKEMKGYFFLDRLYENGICSTETSIGQLAAATFYGHKFSLTDVNAFDGSDMRVGELALGDMLVLCSTTIFGLNQPASLSELDGEFVGSEVQLTQVLPQSVTLFHELWHMVTAWNTDNTLEQDEHVGDKTFYSSSMNVSDQNV
ncbi:uncharacterized protein BO95DRAFT_426981 [Aspergillus brunneoviolaceus CBS 621.78]|uniref:Uncharacterized protein n=1 Tax=Aspergillus brunneoviolaceus CBS 621.78 TaxID=1450534 RepID=A0ACD1GPH7_9EURO|nr:hypothetical protein BO95DRAFT_426981 [Aspergillus brunneoviolaceus CBS 621.78]RAH51161.1 hypothetical protein BO95DRAFT_426981 [Aspergillus brunneoviolaceus CBS 621.78]